jgi:membrane protein DedA with SNARE-associated domain
MGFLTKKLIWIIWPYIILVEVVWFLIHISTIFTGGTVPEAKNNEWIKHLFFWFLVVLILGIVALSHYSR